MRFSFMPCVLQQGFDMWNYAADFKFHKKRKRKKSEHQMLPLDVKS